MLLGFGAAAAVWSSIFLWQHQLSSPASPESGHISSEWSLRTKIPINKASAAINAQERADNYRDALKTLVDQSTNLKTKSADWLAGYADLLRQLGLALCESGRPGEAESPLLAAQSIPLGTTSLRIRGDVELYKLKRDTGLLSEALSLLDPSNQGKQLTDIEVTSGAGANAELYLELGKYLVEKRNYRNALAVFLAIHREMASIQPSNDPLCCRAAAAGYAGQVLWAMDHHQQAISWLERSQIDAMGCQTAACRDTASLAQTMLNKASTI